MVYTTSEQAHAAAPHLPEITRGPVRLARDLSRYLALTLPPDLAQRLGRVLPGRAHPQVPRAGSTNDPGTSSRPG